MPESEYLREYLQYGGQAVVEGVMMRSPRYFSIACRAPNGQIVVHTEPISKVDALRRRLLKIPLVRGSIALIDAVALGSRALKYSTEVQLDPKYAAKSEDDKPDGDESGDGKVVKNADTLPAGAIAATMAVSFMIAMLIFVYVPNVIVEHLPFIDAQSGVQKNFGAGIIKIIFFLAYIWGIGRSKEIHRIFEYHGAEHKAINTLEKGDELTIENCLQQTRLHPRCGTSFAVIVLVVSLVIMTFVPRYPLPGYALWVEVIIRSLLEIVLLPLVAGISYELLRIAGKFRSQTLLMLFFRPGIWMQYLTTQEPDDTQVEVSLQALHQVLQAEKADAVTQ